MAVVVNPNAVAAAITASGAWTPAFQSTDATWVYAAQSGTYTKVGKLVVAQFVLQITSVGGTTSNQAVISGLPFPINGRLTGSVALNNTAGVVSIEGSTGSTATLWIPGGLTTITAANWGSGAFFHGVLIYEAAS